MKKFLRSKDDLIFNIVNYTLLGLALVIYLYPLIYIVSSSFSSVDAVVKGKVWLFPVDFSLDGYKAVFKSSKIWTGYLNSFIYMIVGTAINLVVTLMAAYPLSRQDLKGRNAKIGRASCRERVSG